MKKLFLMERQYIFNFNEDGSEEDEGYTVVFNEDFSGAGIPPTIDITNNLGEDVSCPILANDIHNAINNYLYKTINNN